jgi:hypothetical protein
MTTITLSATPNGNGYRGTISYSYGVSISSAETYPTIAEAVTAAALRIGAELSASLSLVRPAKDRAMSSRNGSLNVVAVLKLLSMPDRLDRLDRDGAPSGELPVLMGHAEDDNLDTKSGTPARVP